MDKQGSLLGKLLWLIILTLSQSIYAETESKDPVTSGTAASEAITSLAQTDNSNSQGHVVFIIYTAESALHSNLSKAISSNLRLKYSDIVISQSTTDVIFLKLDIKPDIVISIGAENSRDTNRYFPNANKLFISTSPGKFRPESVNSETVFPENISPEITSPDTTSPQIDYSKIDSLEQDGFEKAKPERVTANINTTSNNAVLYMTQPFCRQLQFIKLINNDWNIVSLLSSQVSIMYTGDLQQCAKKYNLETKIVDISTDGKLTDGIENALNHSDVLLALPDKNIYNSRTVKNILLTSYRHRKPVIAFSKNFVSAGALAAIYSNTQQISDSSSKLVELFFEHGRQFEKLINYPRQFSIRVNKQVFTALDIALPELDIIQQNLIDAELSTAITMKPIGQSN